ncbi:adenylate/guanylate cyclase domain-containing protein [Jeotgalibacillus salarius]|uniref:Adenylate/guanylate cyclase domain-containing protein n=1 Tax=Jeotgalibacillus salarius TaxID=546023 RepID=A0A4Y8L9T9_9BACL|nr:adenylate/guanylate cyclase domain-containing protein [Jeotgalibacillus salarius]TFD99415.1 adenylate/guanylate cyclase domain-containing protein [Jeotgalibacillus salarius]
MEELSYDFKVRKHKIEEILDNTDTVKEVDQFPNNEGFTYTNGYKAWAGAIFVDLRDSTSLFTEQEDVEIAKVVRGFTSEIIEMLRSGTEDKELKEIGIRGDCVFAVYSAPTKSDVYEIANRAFHINTYMKMLNKLLLDRDLPEIKAGIGLSISPTLAVKAGRKNSGINNLVWIGKSVATAAKLSDLGNKRGIQPIVMSKLFYDNMIELQVKKNSNKEPKSWYTKAYDEKFGDYYHACIIKEKFDDWINTGMK